MREFHQLRCNFAVTSCTDPIILKDNGRGNGVTYLAHKKGYLVLKKLDNLIKLLPLCKSLRFVQFGWELA